MSRLPISLQTLLAALIVAASTATLAHRSNEQARLPVVGAAPTFALVDQDGARFSLDDVRGKVVVLTFIYTTCTDYCPALTAKMASLQALLAADFGTRVRFVSITVQPEVDTPAVLRDYAKLYDANLAGWSFLTGPPPAIKRVVRAYGAFSRRTERGTVDHLFLTSLIDGQGKLRVQYVGYRFKVDEMLADLRALLDE